LETVTDDAYTRFIPQEEGRPPGCLQVSWDGDALSIEFQNIQLSAIRPLMARLRHLFDTDHNPSDLPQNASKLPSGIRIPGCFDAFETAVSLILHQLESSTHARQLMQKLISTYGHQFTDDRIFTFPSAQVLKNAGFESLGLSGQKAEAIRELARLVHNGSLQLSYAADLVATREILAGIPGVEPSTIEWIAMRCLGDADAFPHRDQMMEGAEIADEELWISLRSYRSLIFWRDQGGSIQQGD
jgi:AraC family transcriptional regulator of adaptative response / DNA-3-methyladenine glycosylase II